MPAASAASARTSNSLIPGASEADLLSYILFDGNYSAELVRMGYEDARARHEELANFLKDTVVPSDD